MSSFFKDFVVDILFMLDLKDPDTIRNIQDEIVIIKQSDGSLKTNAFKLLASELGDNAAQLSEEAIPLFELHEFVDRATSDQAGNIIFHLR